MSRGAKPAGRGSQPTVSRGERRRLQIVAVAEQVFLESGFAATTMDMIASAAGASKETLYRHFGRKENLFAEVVSNRACLLRDKLDADLGQPDTLRAMLRDLGVTLLANMTRPEIMALLRIVIAESPRDPMIGRIFITHGPERVRLRLAEYLQAAQRRGEFRGDPLHAATIFLSAVIGSQHLLRMTLSDPPPLSAAEIDERVDEVVAMFMSHYAA